MSLIVARKEGNQIAIVSDTKLTYPNHEIKGQKESPKEGILKTIILSTNLCVSFAGEIEHAENALREIENNCNFNEVVEILYKYHKISNHQTEFLVCSANPNPIIHKIKDNESKEVQTSWIGDRDAFNSFQESMMGTKKGTKSENQNQTKSKAGIVITEMDLSFEVDMQVNLFSKMSSAMDAVIENENIASVGGFKVTVIYKEKFNFGKYGKLYRGNVELFGNSSHVIGHGSANEGAYSINFIGSSNDYKTVALHVRQGNFGLIYTRKNYGLLRPALFQFDEVDFIDYVKEKYNLLAVFATQDRMEKFLYDAKTSFDKQDFRKSAETFDKAFNEATGKKKAEILFYKGICLLNLKEMTSAMQTFQQSINIDSSFQQKIMQILSQRR
jgi:hypothetical protein